jgi:hypothetical protein
MGGFTLLMVYFNLSEYLTTGYKMSGGALEAGEPFVLHASFPEPHQVYCPAEEFWNLYDESTLTLGKVGLSAAQAMLLLFASLFGSAINLPITTIRAEPPPADAVPNPIRSILRLPARPFTGRTLIAVNVG